MNTQSSVFTFKVPNRNLQ